MKASIFNMTMNDQILRQQNESVKKQSEKKKHDRVAADEQQLLDAQEQSKTQSKHRKQHSILTKRRRVAEALVKKNAKSNKTGQQQKTAHTAKLKKGNLRKLSEKNAVQKGSETKGQEKLLEEEVGPAAKNMIKQFTAKMLVKHHEFEKPELEDAEFLQEGDEVAESKEGQDTKSGKAQKKSKTPDVVKEHLSKLSPKEKKDYIAKLLNGSTQEILDTLLDPKYLIGCTLKDEQLLLLKQQANRSARKMRGQVKSALPSALGLIRRAGLGGQLGAAGEGISESSDKDGDSNNAIFAAMAASLELTGLLQKLGIKTEITEVGIESTTATQQNKESIDRANKTIHQIHKNIERSACASLIKVLCCIVAVILVIVGQPEAGLLMLAAASGLIQYLMEKLAKALGMSETGLKALMMAITILIAVMSANPEIMGEEAISGLSAFGRIMMVAGSIGFTTDALGFVATGQTDSSKYPSWVAYTAMGINLAAMLPELGTSLCRAVSGRMAKAAARAASKAADEAVAAEVSAAAAKAEADAAGTTSSASQSVNGTSAADAEANSSAREATGGAQGITAAQGAEAATAAPGQSTTVSSSGAPVEGGAVTSAGDAGTASEAVSSTGQTTSANGGGSAAASDEQIAAKTATKTIESNAADGSDGEDGIAISSATGSNAQGEAAYSVDQAEAGETAPDAEAKDPFKEKLVKAEKALKKAQSDLERLSALQEGAGEGALEDASELTSQVKAAEKEVEKAQQELADLHMKRVEATEQELTAAQEKLAKANEKLEKCRARVRKFTLDNKIKEAKRYVNSTIQRIGKIAMLASTAGEVYAQFKLAEIDTELGENMVEIAEMTGNFELLNTFYEILGVAKSATEQRNQEYSKDTHDEIKLVGDIINLERRAASVLMSA